MTPSAESRTDGTKSTRLCPACQYPLIGLPAVGRCPECGIAYDPHARVFRLRYQPRRVRLVIAQAALTAVICGALVLWGTVAYRRDPIIVSLCAGFVGTFAFFLSGMLLLPFSRVQPGQLVLNQSGLHVEVPGMVSRCIPWDAVAYARYSWITGALCVRDEGGRKVARLGVDLLGSDWDARRAADAINELRRLYLAANTKPGLTP